jgi:hypothetical protein
MEFQQASQTLTGADWAPGFTNPIRRSRKQNHVVFPLVIPFGVKMSKILSEGVP